MLSRISNFFNESAGGRTLLSASVLSAMGNVAIAASVGSTLGAVVSAAIMGWGTYKVYQAEKGRTNAHLTSTLPDGNPHSIVSPDFWACELNRPSFLATATTVGTVCSLGPSFAEAVGITNNTHNISYEIMNCVAWGTTIAGNSAQVVLDKIRKEGRDYDFLVKLRPWQALMINPVVAYCISGSAFSWQYALKDGMHWAVPAVATTLFTASLGYAMNREHKASLKIIEPHEVNNGGSNGLAAVGRLVMVVASAPGDATYAFSQSCYAGSAVRQGVEARQALKHKPPMPEAA